MYNKEDKDGKCTLTFEKCTFVPNSRTADYTTTKMLRSILENDGNEEDIVAFFYNINLPGDEITYQQIVDEVISRKPEQGYLTISNALQWRLQYKRVINLENKVEGIVNFEREQLC